MSKNIIELQEIHTFNVAELVLHPSAELMPLMNDDMYNTLKEDIMINGQIEPITLYRGKIVDGRHRWMILKELNEPSIKAVKMNNNSTLKDINTLVHSKETRRHESATHLAIRAFRAKQVGTYKTYAEAAVAIGANSKRVSEAKKIGIDLGRMDILDNLFSNIQFNVGTTYEPRPTDSLGSIKRFLEELQATAVKNKGKNKRAHSISEDEQLEITSTVTTLQAKYSLAFMEVLSKQLYSSVLARVDAAATDESNTTYQIATK